MRFPWPARAIARAYLDLTLGPDDDGLAGYVSTTAPPTPPPMTHGEWVAYERERKRY